MSGGYQVGMANKPGDDPWFDGLCAAMDHAHELARKDFHATVCIWDWKQDPIKVFVLGEQFDVA